MAADSISFSNNPKPDDDDDVGSDLWNRGNRISEAVVADEAMDGRSLLGFSLTSPDLVICAGSPDVLPNSHQHSLGLPCKSKCSVELSLENGISVFHGDNDVAPSAKISTICQISGIGRQLPADSSFELLPESKKEVKLLDHPLDCMRINAGSTDGVLGLNGVESLQGSCFTGGDSTRTHAVIRDEHSTEAQPLKSLRIYQMAQDNDGDYVTEGDFERLIRNYECQKRELAAMTKALQELKRENQLKNKECQDAWKALKDLQNELMRKSMHVGSLAFAIEGQVKEKSKWFSSLRDLQRRLKILKMEHSKLSEEALTYKNLLEDMKEIRSTVQSTMKQQENFYGGLKNQFLQGVNERKELYNKVLELKGNIRVFCRCRPLNAEEVAAGASMAIDFESAKDGEIIVSSNGLLRKTFKFDAVFGPQAEQADVFKDTAPLATSVLDGYNVCIFAYGQTGTGKTFTMEGTEEARGVNFRTLEEVFRIIKEREKLFQYDISVSVLEVYNEQIRDLLVCGSQSRVASKRLEIRQAGEGLHHVPGLVEAHVNNMSEVWEVLHTGSNARAIGLTNANECSSRSHCIHCVTVKAENLLNGELTRSKLWLVDLAGSERVTKTEVQGERLKETQNINRSLSALGDVISALATKSPHVPFRNSKLTHLLQDSLGGDSKTLMFVQISPNENDLGETLCSLNFASRVKGIELGPAKRQWDSTEILRYKQMAEKSKQDLKSKDMQIKKMEETVHALDMKIKEKDLRNRNLQEKVKELESQLLNERKLVRHHVEIKVAQQQQQQQQQNQEMQLQEDEQSRAQSRPPLANRPLEGSENVDEHMSSAMCNEEVNFMHMEEYHWKPRMPLPATDGTTKYIEPTEKENNPQMAERPKRTGRASICTTARQVPIPPAIAPRRLSLIPLPSAPSYAQQLPSTLSNIEEKIERAETTCLLEETKCDSPKGVANGAKKLSNMLRRSLQRKNKTKSPIQQHLRKGGINVRMEKVRVSIGSRGRLGHRVLLGSGRRATTKDTQQIQSQREKERGWNTGTALRVAM